MNNKKSFKELLKNNFISLIVLVSLISLGAVFAGNVIVKEGAIDVSNNMNVSGNGYISGNLGIGTTNPNARLQVSGSGTAGAINGNWFWIDSLSVIDSDANSIKLGDIGSNNRRVALYANGSEYSSLLGNGNMGIGTTTPSEKLDVVGNVSISQLLKLSSITLPSCSTSIDGAIGRNSTGIYYCNSTTWRQFNFLND